MDFFTPVRCVAYFPQIFLIIIVECVVLAGDEMVDTLHTCEPIHVRYSRVSVVSFFF